MGKINIFIYNNNNQRINLSEKAKNNLLQFLGLVQIQEIYVFKELNFGQIKILNYQIIVFQI